MAVEVGNKFMEILILQVFARLHNYIIVSTTKYIGLSGVGPSVRVSTG